MTCPGREKLVDHDRVESSGRRISLKPPGHASNHPAHGQRSDGSRSPGNPQGSLGRSLPAHASRQACPTVNRCEGLQFGLVAASRSYPIRLGRSVHRTARVQGLRPRGLTTLRLLRRTIGVGSGSDSATELRGRHGGTCFDCGRWRGVTRPSMVGHITPATGAPQRPDATADGDGACTGPISCLPRCKKISKEFRPEARRALFSDTRGRGRLRRTAARRHD
jgi:hypothetical protein